MQSLFSFQNDQTSPPAQAPRRYENLDKSQLGGRNVKSIDIGCQAGIGLLGSIRARSDKLAVVLHGSGGVKGRIPDEGVDLNGVDVIQLLEGKLDLGLVGLDVDDEDEGVVLLNLLHGALGVERVHDDLVLIETGRMGNRLAGILGRARELEGLGPVEGGRGPDLAVLVGVHLGKRRISLSRH